MSAHLHPDNNITINPTDNESIRDVLAAFTGRRNFMKGSIGTAVLASMGGFSLEALAAGYVPSPTPTNGGIGFNGVPANIAPMTDGITVPNGYTAKVFISWGDAIGKAGPEANTHWDPSTAMTKARQLTTWGSHNDGMHLFPFPAVGVGGLSNDRGLLVSNFEYVDPGLVNNTLTYGTDVITQDMVDAQLAAHGVGVVEVRKIGGEMKVQRPSAFARRITGATPCKVSGPAAGHPMLRTAADPAGMTVLGTLNNCAHGYTPWGTYLACEENFNGYFGTTAAKLAAQPRTPHEARYGVSQGGFGYRWHEADPRFDFRENPNELNRHGWVVEIDPWNPNSMPVKRTALGRFKHEGAWSVVGADNSVALYMGDDEINDYIYKFVCAKKLNTKNRAANRDLLDSGTLYVARFNADGTGVWLPLVFGQNGLTSANGFNSQGDVVIMCRQAADLLGATKMDRPEWVAVHPTTREVYFTLTNNSGRTVTDAANPRANNVHGHIIRFNENGGDVAATGFQWDIFAECGDKLSSNPARQGNIIGDDLGSPDGLWFDSDGRLWIQTDQAGDATGNYANIGGNAMFCADPATRQITRFLTSPIRCEVTGVVTTPDNKTMFVNIQHPGESWSGSFTSRSTWPDSGINGPTTQSASGAIKPRSATVIITKDDGGVIGT
ncbi:PhoX family phosphatase [Methyloversatilis sp. XJ19-13]|uniref:PhoX family protein n=1 Tax=Methyloversatilis sp. XJ19-13 TaxID=2963430 RepID=UPI00211BA37B|nr:PhoX family phosphatase [Methyloversatilis sp. XJ19-13]MCQ9375622.1 PhoX family phosphatase [Methyloversatilis sp. XJ19-13]